MNDIEGVVESIIFQNEENGYVVAKFSYNQGDTTIVGCIPYISEGQNLNLTGEWVKHPQFGEQFKVQSAKEIIPNSTDGIEKYLSSGLISGIGPVTAKKIVQKYGDKTLEIFDNQIEKLSEIEGIGDKKIKIIAESYNKQREIRNIMVFLQTYGVTPNQCIKIYKAFGMDSIKIVKENPYILTEEITGIGFKTADKIARSLGVDSKSSYRISSGIKYVINDFCSMGNTYMPLEILIDKAQELLNVEKDKVEKSIFDCALEQKIKIENIGEQKCVYTLPYYYCEIGTAKKLISLAYSSYNKIGLNIDSEINEFQSVNDINFSESQKDAIRGAFENGVEIITGGPGTGKTTIIKCITYIFERAGMRVFMAAPTGRAAKRMSLATGREAKTIHRLLELGFDTDENMVFFKNDEVPLECDVIIIDEASMIDILLMNNLMKAIGLGTRLIIVGDVDQLPSVGPGNVLKDIIQSECLKVIRLKDIFRQAGESMIVRNAHKINNGEMPVLNEKGKDFYFINSDDANNIKEILIDLYNKRIPKYNPNWKVKEDIQILTPMRKGILGVDNLNKELQEILNPLKPNQKEKKVREISFRAGDKVMQIKNNYTLKWEKIYDDGDKEGEGVFNGDMGIIEAIDEENNTVSVILDEDKRVIYENSNLDELELSYAITIHKSQGSEFPVVIIPSFMGPPLLMNRNLLYTGITRAKKLLVMVGTVKAISTMVKSTKGFQRYSALKERIVSLMDK